MRVAVPHNLPREEVRRRMRERSHEIGDHIPGGMAQVETDWVGEDRMAISISAMGQNLTGHVEVEDSQLVFQVELPLMLSFIEPMVAKAFKEQGAKMLAPPAE